MANYLKQLSADLPRWVNAGFVTAENSAKILADVEAQQSRSWFRLPTILGGLGAILVFVGIISYIASSWNDIPRLARVALLIAFMASAYLTGHHFRQKGSEGLGSAFAFLGALIFGANLMLIAQIYNLPPNPPGGALLWALGAALTAILWPSQMAMMLAFALAAVWNYFASASTASNWGLLFDMFDHRTHIHWPFILLWGVLAAISVKRGWTKAMHLAGISLCWWVMTASFSLFDEYAVRFGGLIVAIILLALTGAGRQLKIAQEGTGIVSRYMLFSFALWLLVVTVPEAYRGIMYMRSADVVFIQPGYTAAYMGALLLCLAAGIYGVMFNRLRTIAAIAALGAFVPLLAHFPGFFVTSGADYYGYSGTMAGSIGFVSNIVLAIVALAAAIGAIVQGYRTNDRFLLNIGFWFFALKLAILYFDTFWSFGGRAGFFIVSGLLVIAMAIGFEKQRRKLISKMEANHV